MSKIYQKPVPDSILGIRNWGKYAKPFTFNIIVQSMDEVKNYKGERNDEHCMSNSQSRYVF